MLKAYSVETIQAVEQPYISAPDYDGWLMRRAALALAEKTHQNLLNRDISQGKIMLLVGKGNNGADVLYAGIELMRLGHSVLAYLASGEAAADAVNDYRGQGGHFLKEPDLQGLIPQTDVILDGIVGIGMRGKLSNQYLELVENLNHARHEQTLFPQIIACDVPSGLSPMNQSDEKNVLQADETVTFIAAKDFMLGPAERFCGKLHVVPLGIEKDLEAHPQGVIRLSCAELVDGLRRPQETDHKYSRGVCGIIAGSSAYPGAGLLTTLAAAHTGVGMVKFRSLESLNFHITAQVPEAVLSHQPIEQEKVDAWVIGPGANTDERQTDMVSVLAGKYPAVIDAGALELAAQWIYDHGKLSAHHILTPHAGELLRLLTWIYSLNNTSWQEVTDIGAPSKEAIAENPLFWVRLTAQLTGATVMLKGHTTLVATPEGQIYSYRSQTSWLATAGSGDTLSGILGSLLAQHEAASRQDATSAPEDYARLALLAVHLHNQAALSVNGGKLGPVPASLVSRHLPQAIADALS